MAFQFPKLDLLGPAQVEQFQRDGFIVIERVLEDTQLGALRESFPKLFAGKFDTGVYPDEWYWREGMSLPDVTRHMSNAWKADLSVASLALSESVGRAVAYLTGWDGARLGQDTIWWKAPNTKPIAHHQDSSFMDFLDPPQTATFWITLDDTSAEAGTLEYVAGSHKWPLTSLPESFHGQSNYRAQMLAASHVAGVDAPEPTLIIVPAGSCVIHAGEIWHGSGPNVTTDRMRRSIGVHLVSDEARFSDRPGGYIYRRYQKTGDPSLDESFFPRIWSMEGKRTDWLERYCENGRRI